MSNVLALNGEIAPAPTVGALQRGVLRRPVELTGEDRSRQPMIGAAVLTHLRHQRPKNVVMHKGIVTLECDRSRSIVGP